MEQQKDIIQAFIKLGCKCSNNGRYLQDIHKWLIDVKSMYICAQPYMKNSWWFEIVGLSEFHEDFGLKLINVSECKYTSYEEALEAGIWEAYYLINN